METPNIAFQPLVALTRKKIPATFNPIHVNINQMQNKKPIQRETTEELEEGEIQETPVKPNVLENVILVDQRKITKLNRDEILLKLNMAHMTHEIIEEKHVRIGDINITEFEKETPESASSRELPKTRPFIEEEEEEEEHEVEAEADVEQAVESDTEEENEETKEAESKVVPTAKPKRSRKPKAAAVLPSALSEIDLNTALLNGKRVLTRLPAVKSKDQIRMRASPYYMNNRKMFIQKLATMFKPYKDEILRNAENVSCNEAEKNDVNFDLLTHQLVVRNYLNLYTPYRGLLLYHGLGSGKTCSSIAIAEGMKTSKKIVIMTPASLKMNFFSELKKCGDHIFRKKQYWEFISTEGNEDNLYVLAKALSLPPTYIKSNKGAWMVNVKKEPNFSMLSESQQKEIDEQLNLMIRAKYIDINYNGLNSKIMKELTQNNTINPFDNAVVIIDEAHNMVSRISNKLKAKKTIPYMLYHYLMNATNANVVLLTGTPIINYPHEIGILFNILRGYIKTWRFQLSISTKQRVNRDAILDMFDEENFRSYDFVEYSGNNLVITRNPFGFINAKKRTMLSKKGGKTKKSHKTPKSTTKKVRLETTTSENQFVVNDGMVFQKPIDSPEIENEEETLDYHYKHMEDYQKGGARGETSEVFDSYNGVYLDEAGNISDDDFKNAVVRILAKNGINVVGEVKLELYKALPDEMDSFINTFIEDNGVMKNVDLFKRRILGLNSYFRSAQEQLLPRFVLTPENSIYHIEKIPMSDHQFGVYFKIRSIERDREKKSKTQKRMAANVAGDYKISSSYRIFSRACCNFAFPANVERPLPDKINKNEITENIIDAVQVQVLQQADDYIADVDATKEKDEPEILSYHTRIVNALEQLRFNPKQPKEEEYLKSENLGSYSPKFLKILENLSSPEYRGLHLLYSQFRTIEGIGILKLILEANGYVEFKIKKIEEAGKDSKWDIEEIEEEDMDKPRFVLYTGTESQEEREIIRNIYNSSWELIPPQMATKLRSMAENNYYGSIIKLMMITSSGAEGINLKNTRYVHIVEPYWNMTRLEQVVGRARRICSHQDLPVELRTVQVFIYIATFTKEQMTNEKHKELTIHDLSKIDNKTPVSTDETLYEISARKDNTNRQLLKAIKESAIDCSLHKNKDESLMCYNFGKVSSNQFASHPTIEEDKGDQNQVEIKEQKWRPKQITLDDGVKYVLNENTNEVYDFDSYNRFKETGEEMILIGHLITKDVVVGKKKVQKYEIERI
jgi:hypothetical protein